MHPRDVIIQNVRAGYGEHEVLHNVSATLPGGKISAVLGGSGGGKSTLLRHCLGLEDVMSGTITMGGVCLQKADAQALQELRKSVGVLFQNGALLGSLPLSENVAMPLREHTELDETTIETMVRMKLELVGLEHAVGYLPNALSGGMRKRAGLARAIVLDPKFLFCDEPSAGLDPITAAELDQLLLCLNDTFEMTIVVVTHDLESVFAVAEHVVVLYEGRVLYQGDVQGMRDSRDDYLQSFLHRLPKQRSGREMACGYVP